MKKKKLKAEIKCLNALLLESREQCLRLEDEFLLRLQTEQSILDQIARIEADNAKYSQIEIKGRVLALIQFIKQAIRQEALSDLLAKEQAKRILPIERTVTVTCSGTGKPTQLIVSGTDQNGLPVVEKIEHREHEFQVGDLIRRNLKAECEEHGMEYEEGTEDEAVYMVEKVESIRLLCRIQGDSNSFVYSFLLGWVKKEHAYPYTEPFPVIISELQPLKTTNTPRPYTPTVSTRLPNRR